jgi:fatty acid desaturase/cytochrome b involved in lipid metabolism
MGKGGCVNPEVNTKKVTATATATAASSSNNNKEITYAHLATKNTVEECWIAYEGNVYDATHWLVKHPGGIRSIMSAAGSDASAVMKSLHTPATLKTVVRRIRKVGTLVEDLSETISTSNEKENDNKLGQNELNTMRLKALKRKEAIEKDFNELNERLVREGWYDAQPMKYWAAILRNIAILIGGICLMLWSQKEQTHEFELLDSQLTRRIGLTFGSMLIGFYFQNVAFAGHDAGHGSISGSFAIDKVIGIIIGNLLTGIDMGWWKSTHYVHHSATNSLHDDPDIQHMPLLCLDERMSENRWSTYHGKYMLLDSIAKTLLPYQHWYFYPVLGVARVNLYIQSVIYLVETCPFFINSNSMNKAGESFINETTGEVKEKYAWPKQKALTWTASVIGLIIFQIAMIKYYLSFGLVTGLYCFFVTHVTAGLLHVQILLSHICMHYCEDGPGTSGAISAPNGNNEAGYHEWQALSTMDIDCPPWMDWFHGGLQFQLEHHIFPRVPRWNLRKLCVLTDEIYAKHDVPVVRMSFIKANMVMLKHMAEVGANVTKTKAD